MAKSTCPVVTGEQYCYEEEVKLEMKEEWMVNCGGFVIKDIHGKELFQVDHYGYHISLDKEMF